METRQVAPLSAVCLARIRKSPAPTAWGRHDQIMAHLAPAKWWQQLPKDTKLVFMRIVYDAEGSARPILDNLTAAGVPAVLGLYMPHTPGSAPTPQPAYEYWQYVHDQANEHAKQRAAEGVDASQIFEGWPAREH